MKAEAKTKSQILKGEHIIKLMIGHSQSTYKLRAKLDIDGDITSIEGGNSSRQTFLPKKHHQPENETKT
jgi:hypothetical protein